MTPELIFLCTLYVMIGMGAFDACRKIGLSTIDSLWVAAIWPYVLTSAAIQRADMGNGRNMSEELKGDANGKV
jgi:hypothetical protein